MKKLITFGLSAATVLSMAGGALLPVAGALTVAELQAQIAALTAQIAALSGGSTSTTTCYAFTADLTEGSTGPDVTTLQNYLQGTGHFTFAGGATGYFGSVTKAAVAAWQAANGVAPAYGYFGPVSRAKYASLCVVTPPADDDEEEEGGGAASGLEGGAGSITVTALSTYGDETVGEAEEDVMVLGFKVEADDESDIDLTSVKVEMNQQDTSNSEDLDEYAELVSVWMGSEKVGEAEAGDFSEQTGHIWTKNIALDGAIVKAGETEKFYLAVTALDGLDSGDINDDDWQIGISSMRFLDGDGVSTTESFTLDIDDNTVDDTLEEEFDFGTYAAATNVEMEVALNDADEAINESHVVNAEDSAQTEDIEVLSFTIEAKNSDLNITEIPVVFTTGGETNESILLTSAHILLDGEEIGDETVADGGAVTFDDLDVDIAEDEVAEFMITVDVPAITGGAADNGDTVAVVVTVDDIEAEDETGEEIADADATGSANGEAIALYESGIELELVSVDKERTFIADAATETDQGTYEIVFKVTAFDEDMYVDASTEDDNAANVAGQGLVYDLTMSGGTATVSDDSFEVSDTETLDEAGGEFWIEEGDSRTFTLTVVLTGDAGNDGSYELVMESLNWIDAPTAEAAGGVIDADFTNYYTFNLGAFKTGSLFLNDM